MAFLPVFAIPGLTDINIATTTASNDSNVGTGIEVSVEDIQNKERDARIAKINKYYADRSMPLAGHAEEFVKIAERYNLDWRLLPAIAVRESSGGKNACYNNPFGWGSCKIKFSTYEQAIDAVGKNLGGFNPKTSSYYANKTNLQKLYYYNGTVVPSYPREVLAIMDRIDNIQLD